MTLAGQEILRSGSLCLSGVLFGDSLSPFITAHSLLLFLLSLVALKNVLDQKPSKERALSFHTPLRWQKVSVIHLLKMWSHGQGQRVCLYTDSAFMETQSHLLCRPDSKGPPAFLPFLAEAARIAEKSPSSAPDTRERCPNEPLAGELMTVSLF